MQHLHVGAQVATKQRALEDALWHLGKVKADTVLRPMRRAGHAAAARWLAERVEGIVRNVGMHAGGVLIAPGKLTDFCPLYCADSSTSGALPSSVA